MDNIPYDQIAAKAAELFTLYILPKLIGSGKNIALKVGEKIEDATAEWLWQKLQPKVAEKEAMQEPLENLMKDPGDAGERGELESQIRRLLKKDAALAKELQPIVNISADNGSVAANEINHSNLAVGQNAQAAESIINITQYFRSGKYEGPKFGNSQEALNAYRAYVAELTGRLPLIGIDRNAANPAMQDSIGLENVYIDLDTTAQVEVKEDGKERSGERKPLSALGALIENRRLIIKGIPGSGKSTFVNYLAHSLALKNAKALKNWKEDENDLLPVIIILRDFIRAHKKLPERLDMLKPTWILDFVKKRLKDQNLPPAFAPIESLLKDGKAIVFFDGLDEVTTVPQRIFVRDAVQAFANHFSKNRFVVTCRVLSYVEPKGNEPELRLAGFPEFELDGFDKPKINRFIERWYDELTRLRRKTREEADMLRDGLKASVRRKELARLAPNPLLLTVMALVNTDEGRLPDARAVLYEKAVETLLWNWEQGNKSLENATLRQLLLAANCADIDLKRIIIKLAYAAHEQTETSGENDETMAGIPESRLEDELLLLKDDKNWARDVLRALKLRAGLLIEIDTHVFTFPHRSFQEFLAGAFLEAQDNFVETAMRLADNPLQWKQVILWAASRYVYLSPKFDRPLFLAAELCPDGEPQTEKDWSKVWLAGEILLEVGVQRALQYNAGKKLFPHIQTRLKELLEGSHLTPIERAAAGITLAKLGDPRPGVMTDFVFCKIPKGKFMMGSKDGEGHEDKSEYPQFEHAIVEDYYMSRYPITNAQFDLFVKDEGYKAEKYWDAAKKAGYWSADGFKGAWDNEVRTAPYVFPAPFNLPNHPVVGVSWYEAVAFCQWLTIQMQKEECRMQIYNPESKTLESGEILHSAFRNPHFEIRLPSEAEWEYAARGGKENRPYSWEGGITTNHANYDQTGIGATSAVGLFPNGENAFGLLDMSGNVWEWCLTKWQDDYKDYLKNETELNSLEGDARRVGRGGAFDYEGSSLRCAIRVRCNPSNRFGNQGFRVVVSASFPISHSSGS